MQPWAQLGSLISHIKGLVDRQWWGTVNHSGKQLREKKSGSGSVTLTLLSVLGLR